MRWSSQDVCVNIGPPRMSPAAQIPGTLVASLSSTFENSERVRFQADRLEPEIVGVRPAPRRDEEVGRREDLAGTVLFDGRREAAPALDHARDAAVQAELDPLGLQEVLEPLGDVPVLRFQDLVPADRRS